MPPMTERERLIANLMQAYTDEQLDEILIDLVAVVNKRKQECIEKAKQVRNVKEPLIFHCDRG